MKYKCLIFDLDGTLVNSIHALTYCTNLALEKFGLGPLTETQMKMIVGECAQYADGFPQVICGDFNSGIENAPVACLRDAGWQEAYEAVHGPGEAGFTYHGFKGPDYRKKNARRIDFIFVRGNLRPSRRRFSATRSMVCTPATTTS